MADALRETLAESAADAPRPRRAPRRRLFRKYAAFFVAVVSVALLANGAFEIWFSYRDHEASLIGVEREEARGAAGKIEQFISEIESQIGWTTELPWSAATLDQRRFDALRLLRQVPAITELAQLDASGHEQLRVSRLEMDVVGSGTDYSHDPRFTDAMAKKAWFGPVYFRRESEPYMTLAMAGARRDAGVSVAEVNLKFIWDVVSAIKVGQHGIAYVVDGDGRLIAHPDISLVLRNTSLARLPQVAAALQGMPQETLREAADPSGKPVLTAWAKIAPMGWYVFVELPLDEANAPLYASIERAGALLAGCLLLAFLAALFLARRMAVPIEALRAGAARIGGGDLGQRISIKTGDELESLADQFNDMAGRLSESYAGLERKVEARTQELSESLDRQTAMADVLRAISSSPGELGPVFEAILTNATRLSESPMGILYRWDGDALHVIAMQGVPPAFEQYIRSLPVYRMGPHTNIGRMVATKMTVSCDDLAAMPYVAAGESQPVAAVQIGGIRSCLHVPMLNEKELIGAFVVYRQEVRPFADKEIELVENFAAQAVIAIENARLLTELRESLEQQTATSDVLRVISSSPGELQPVFETMLANAARICEVRIGTLFRYDGDAFYLLAHRGIPQKFLDYMANGIRPAPETGMARMLREQQTVHITDPTSDRAFGERDPLRIAAIELGGAGTMLMVPLIKENMVVGAFILGHSEIAPFADKQIELVENFAAQAVIAIENARLLTELRESLERQTATSNVLGVIASSPGQLEPVFDTILENALRLCETDTGHVARISDGQLNIVALRGAPAAFAEFVHDRAIPAHPDGPVGRAISHKQPVQVADLRQGPQYLAGNPMTVAAVELAGVRTVLYVPIVRGEETLGLITIYRRDVRAFAPKHVELAENFAQQAVIAIENARLLSELRESLDRQTATSEVLGVISSSPGQLDPVFDTILENAMRLCEADTGNLMRRDGDSLRFAAMRGARPEFESFVRQELGGFVDAESLPGQAMRDRSPLHVADLRETDAYARRVPATVASVEIGGIRTVLCVPMMRDEEAVGVLVIYRREVRPFAQKHIDLVSNFAKQAVIAIENARLLTELRESLDQQTATAEVLQVINASPGDLGPVFDAVLDKALTLCQAAFGLLHTYDGERFRALAMRGIPAAAAELLRSWVPDPGSALEQLAQGARVVHIPDLVDSDAYRARIRTRVILVEQLGGRTALWVALRRDEALLGAFVIYRKEVRPFSASEIALLENFAAQAVIAIENARLLSELRESLDRQTATSEVLGVISSSPGELRPVFETMLANAVRICEAAEGNLMRVEEGAFRLLASHGTGYERLADTFDVFRPLPSNPMVRMIETRRAVHVHDFAAYAATHDEDTGAREFVAFTGTRTWLAVPMVKDDEVVGEFNLSRREVRPFTDKQIELVENFAKQAVIAIENARLLTELRESLDRQTATSEVLGVISASPGQLQPVFQSMLSNALRLCEARRGSLYLYDGDMLELAETAGEAEAMVDQRRQRGRYRLSGLRGTFGRVITTKRTVQVADLRTDEGYLSGNPNVVATVETGGARSSLTVPLTKDGEVIGLFNFYRTEVRPFSEKQIELLENFAKQAVIAIENARLLSELRARTDELARSVEELRALGEVSQAVNSSLDLQTVLTAIVTNSVRLSATDAGAIYVYDEGADEFALRATFGMDEHLIAAIRDQHIRFGAAGIGEAAERRAPVQIPDLRAGERSAITAIIVEAGFRALLVMPLLRPGRVVGALVVRRRAPGEFAAATVDLLQTFAAQSVAAIENARLFGEIEEKSRELVVASQHKSQFLANMSHELRTPLNAILGYTELILDDIYGAAPARMREVLTRVQTNGKHLLGLINDVLDLSKIEAGQLVLSLAPYSVKDMLQGVYVAVEPLASTKKIALKLDLATDLPPAKGDERRLSQVVLNLVGNAIKFTDEGEVTIAATASNGSVLVQVKDTGPGIAAADQQKIFEEFQQADNSATRSKGGTGLGLAISRRIVALHGGRLWVESALGKGSTFSVSLPVTVERQVGNA